MISWTDRVKNEVVLHTVKEKLDVCLSVQSCICVENKNQLDATEWLIALII
jgi:hypothetical protein